MNIVNCQRCGITAIAGSTVLCRHCGLCLMGCCRCRRQAFNPQTTILPELKVHDREILRSKLIFQLRLIGNANRPPEQSRRFPSWATAAGFAEATLAIHGITEKEYYDVMVFLDSHPEDNRHYDKWWEEGYYVPDPEELES